MVTIRMAEAVLIGAVIVAINATAPNALGDVESENVRVWTDAKGRQIRAALVAVGADSITLNKEGKVYLVQIDRLSEADRQYVREFHLKHDILSYLLSSKYAEDIKKPRSRVYTVSDEKMADDLIAAFKGHRPALVKDMADAQTDVAILVG
ncbi:MAG: hypothetical protein IH987_09940, partial [Planctomycetes bacterium]|nr:hypothetical protein [Planctomycetota bacterium]